MIDVLAANGGRAVDRPRVDDGRSACPSARALRSLSAAGCVAVAAIALATSQPALAAVVRAEPYRDPPGTAPDQSCTRPGGSCPQSMLTVTGGPGERNLLTLTPDGEATLVADTGAALTAGDGCVTSAGGAVRCTRVDGGVRVHAGDGDDRIEALEVSGRYSGDDGADVIVARGVVLGGPENDRLTGVGIDARVAGEAGDDALSAIDAPVPLPAGTENDVELFGGDGDDNIRGGTGMATIYGGDGNDTVRGARGESAIYGGAGDDDLRGADYIKGEAGNDRILGTTGRDRLRGGPGADVISGGAGSDDLRGDHGPDRISAADGERDGVDCGAGRDRLVSDRDDRYRRCEQVRRRRGQRA
jgi:Ca2+-binding RTX toxin-like protein